MTERVKNIPEGHGLCLVQVTAPGVHDVAILGRVNKEDDWALIAGIKLIDFELHSGVDTIGDSNIIAVPCFGLSDVLVQVDCDDARINCKTEHGQFPTYPSPDTYIDIGDLDDLLPTKEPVGESLV